MHTWAYERATIQHYWPSIDTSTKKEEQDKETFTAKVKDVMDSSKRRG
jgi:hypothetical protein